MLKKSFYKKQLFILSLVTSLCLSGCASADTSSDTETMTESSLSQTTEAMESTENFETTETTSETVSVETSVDDISSVEPDTAKEAGSIAYAADLDSAIWSDGSLDIRFPEHTADAANWDMTLPIPLWGETDVTASIPAPLTLDNIKAAGYSVTTSDGSTAAFISDGSANSYIVGYLKDASALDYVVVSLDAGALLGTTEPTLQNVLEVLGAPTLGFAYEDATARYYYLYENFYLEVSMGKSDNSWVVSEVMYYDSSAFLNYDSNQEISSIITSGLNGFSSAYIASESYQTY